MLARYMVSSRVCLSVCHTPALLYSTTSYDIPGTVRAKDVGEILTGSPPTGRQIKMGSVIVGDVRPINVKILNSLKRLVRTTVAMSHN